jgi:hypothetical protein
VDEVIGTHKPGRSSRQARSGNRAPHSAVVTLVRLGVADAEGVGDVLAGGGRAADAVTWLQVG